MKRILLIILILIVIILIILKSNSIKNKLMKLGYEKEIAVKITKTFNKNEITQYLLETKYNNLFEYYKSPVFNINNIKRYYKYDLNNNYDGKDIVLYTEIGLDNNFYTNIKPITDKNNELVLVNKYNKLKDNFIENDLITLDSNYSKNNQKVKKEIYSELTKMINAASKENIKLTVISGYRTEQYQDTLFKNSISKNGIEHALMYSAKKGHSEHQTGYAVDFNIAETVFKDTKEYKWLKDNSYKYGFIERYPKDKEFITGYSYEPWHYRFVGNHSKIIYQNNLTLEEYIVLKDFLNKK